MTQVVLLFLFEYLYFALRRYVYVCSVTHI